LLPALDKTITDLAYDFSGEGAFSFATEADVQAALFGRLRANVLFYMRTGNVKRELVHAEFPAFGAPWKGRPRHDLTIWHPDLAEEARKRWGTPPWQWPEELRRRINLIAIEIERFAGLTWNIRQYQMLSREAQSVVTQKVREHADIRKLKTSWCQFGYFLIFWDDDVQDKQDLKACFNCLHKAFVQLAQEDTKLHFYCICRDGSIFRVPQTYSQGRS
jgi:hypothetical protein